MPRAILIPIGSEVTAGVTVDTNSAFLSRELSHLGFEIIQHIAVKDDEAQITRVLEQALAQADLLITTGGLGPTFDDITKDVLTKFSGQSPIFDSRQFGRIKAYFRKRKRKIHSSARQQPQRSCAGTARRQGNWKFRCQQAFFPQGCLILDNPIGVAAGFGFETEGKWIIALPGVPPEMEGMFRSQVAPFLVKKFPAGTLLKSISAKIIHLSEVEVLKKLGTKFPPKEDGVSCGIYPAAGEVTLRMTFRGRNKKKIRSRIQFWGQYFHKKLGKNLISLCAEALEEVIGKLLTRKRQTLALAESITGGLIAKRLTDIAGASRYLKGGVVVYSDEAKMKMLAIEKSLLSRYSAVSAQVAGKMAKSVRNRFGTVWGLSVTGIAGPGHPPLDQPAVGTVFVGLSSGSRTVVRKYLFCGTRDRIRWLASQAALTLLREALLDG